MQEALRRVPIPVTLAAFWLASMALAQSELVLPALGLAAVAAAFLPFGRIGVIHGAGGLLAIWLAAARLGLQPDPAQELDPSLLQPDTLGMTGVIGSQPQFRAGAQSFVLEAEELVLANGPQAVRMRAFVRYMGYEQLEEGTRVHLKGTLTQAPRAEAGGFGLWLEGQRIRYNLRAYSAQSLGPAGWDPFRDLRQRLRQATLRSLPDPVAAVVLALSLGDTSRIPPDVRDWFAGTGTAHFLALSGWNISLVAGLLLALITPLAGRRWAAAVSIAGIVGYVALVGPQPSVVRAGIMGVMVALAMAAYRGHNSLATVSVAALLMTLIDPGFLRDLGFQLSFAATLGIVLLGPQLRPPSLPRALSDPLAATLAASAAVLPLTAATFGRFSLIAPLANLVLAPLLPVCVLLGTAASIAGIVSQELANVVAWPTWLSCQALLSLLKSMSSLPASSVSVHFPPPGVLVVYLGLGALGLALWQRHHSLSLYLGGAVAGLTLGLLLLPVFP